MNSKQKGKRGELEWSHYLSDHGFPARRTQQYAGTDGTSDVTCHALDAYHQEVKRVEHLNLRLAVEQAASDAAGKVPIVAHRTNRTPWLVTMLAEDWLRLVGATQPVFEPSTPAPARDATP